MATLERVFGTPIERFSILGLHGLLARLGYLRTFYANARQIRLPGALQGLVTGVIGLSDADLPIPQLAVPSPRRIGSLRLAARAPAVRALLAMRAGSLSGIGAGQGLASIFAPALGAPVGQDGGATPCPQAVASGASTAPDLATGYDFNGLYAQGLHGEGMSAALVEFDDYHDSNVQAVESCYGVLTQVARRLVDGGGGGPPAAGEAEDMADITTLLELVPKLAHLYVYVAPITGLGAVLNEGNAELDLYNAFVTDDLAPVLSSSWGNCEELNSAAYDNLFGDIAEEAAAQGQQIFDAAGDSGAVDCRGYPPPTKGSISVEQEAAVPWITGVGGTDLAEGSTVSGGVHHETVWNDGGAGGGGQSSVWPMPYWQQSYLKATGDTPPGEADPCGSPSGRCRMVPDIALNADPDLGGAANGGPTPPQFTGSDVGLPGDDTYCATSNCELSTLIGGPPTPAPEGAGGWYPIGGTSLATPTAAAAAVPWDQLAKKDGLSGLGFLNPSLYRIASNPRAYASAFYNIAADGYNGSDGQLAADANANSNDDRYDSTDCPTGCNPQGLYKAATGYNMASGLGSFDAAVLGDDLIADSRAIDLTPSVATMYGYIGGPTTTQPVSVTSGYYGSRYSATPPGLWSPPARRRAR